MVWVRDYIVATVDYKLMFWMNNGMFKWTQLDFMHKWSGQLQHVGSSVFTQFITASNHNAFSDIDTITTTVMQFKQFKHTKKNTKTLLYR